MQYKFTNDGMEFLTLEEIVTKIKDVDVSEICRALNMIFPAYSTRMGPVGDIFLELTVYNSISDIDSYITNLWRNGSLQGAYASDSYAVALCLVYKLLRKDAILDECFNVSEYLSYFEYEYAKTHLDYMSYLLQYWSNWSQNVNDGEVIHLVELLSDFNTTLVDILEDYCHPYSEYDDFHYKISLMAGEGWKANENY